MPFKSKAQQRFLYAHPEKIGGKVKLKEWASKTNFSSIPEKIKVEKVTPLREADFRVKQKKAK